MIFVTNTLKPTKHNNSYVAEFFVYLGQKWQVMGYVVILQAVLNTAYYYCLAVTVWLCYTISSMAEYKVPQDVEADDKLLGPFSFRQFIYLIIVVLAIAMAWGLWQLFVPLAIIPLPVILFFSALALPLRKDQPMETYMAAMVSFFLKPHQRLWDPDGVESLIEITVPKIIEYSRTKDLTTSEAERRFDYLAEIVDSQGWAVRGAGVRPPNSAMHSDVYFEAQSATDVLDDNNSRVQSIDDKLIQSNARRFQDAIDNMKKTTISAPLTQVNPTMPSPSSYFGGVPLTETTVTPNLTTIQPSELEFNPYPTILQSVIQPIGQKKPAEVPPLAPPTTSEKVIPAGIINLATNVDLSIATIASEANRIQKQYDYDQEVFIKLR